MVGINLAKGADCVGGMLWESHKIGGMSSVMGGMFFGKFINLRSHILTARLHLKCVIFAELLFSLRRNIL